MTIPKLLIAPRRPALLAGHDNELDVLVRVQAPQVPAEMCARAALHLSLVIDRSGSMAGQPLDEAKRCAQFMVDGLLSTDRVSVVAYDHDVQTLAAAEPLQDRDKVRRAIQRIFQGGTTNLHGGWLAGAETLAPHTRADVISRVILLSDGNANKGLVDPDLIFRQCGELARAGVTTSTYGLGNAFNEDLMIGMARHGHGSSYYGNTAADLMDPFREEFALLNATCARRLRLDVEPSREVEVSMLNEYLAAHEPTADPAPVVSSWWLPDLAYEGEAWAVLRLKVAKGSLAESPASSDLIHVTVRYVGLDGEPRAIQSEPLSLEALPASAFDSIAEDELVARRVGEVEAARLHEQARDAARREDWDAVGAVISRASSLAGNNEWVQASLADLRAMAQQRDSLVFAKAAAFQSARMHRRLAEQNEDVRGFKERAVAYLRRKARQGKGDETPPG